MKLDRALRIAVAVLTVVAFLVAIGALLFVTESALNVWDRLLQGPAVLRWLFVGVLVLIALANVWLVWRFVVPRRRARSKPAPPVLTRERLAERVREAEAQGVEAGAAALELDRLHDETGSTTLSLVLFGEVSTGKSSLTNALLPDSDVRMSPIAGSTQDVRRYTWESAGGVRVELADLPGTDAVGKALDASALEEARRAHAVIFVCDGDLTRQQVDLLTRLRELGKPLIVALNKADRYRSEELQRILARMTERLARGGEQVAPSPALVVTTAGGEETVVERDASGEERLRVTERAPDISQLVMALDELLGRDIAGLRALREQALLSLAADKLEAAERAYREQRAEQIIRSATKKAVIGALAAVTPGTDIVIQGYLGSMMTRELCRLYGQEPRDIEIERFLDLSQSRVGRAVPISLAVAGNGLKAFPGIGTVAGGLVHAVAYGLIFDAVGRSLRVSLERDEAFSPETASAHVAEGLDEYLEQGVRRVARIALEQTGDTRRND